MRVALVTGAAHRLGRALALGLGRAGFRVAVHYRSSPTEARETLRLLREQGADGEIFPADLSEPGAPQQLVASVVDKFGRLDALLHSASPWIEKPLDQVTEEDWESTFGIGPRAAFFLAQAAAPELSAAGGALLFVSDVAAIKAWPRHIPHCAAKAALQSLVVNLAAALGPRVRVNGIAPGIVLPPESLLAEELARLVERTPLKRQVAVEDLVNSAVHLIENRSITGQILAVDAGRSIV
jgi:pteridine reductase